MASQLRCTSKSVDLLETRLKSAIAADRDWGSGESSLGWEQQHFKGRSHKCALRQ
jgi:hypothetical protein